ncbi:Serine/threonine-protein kinase/endoribonuclease IRE1 [Golovinomyces cichoracearum]|uniref:non-specific serine/threonine protein kinase n=1 Tax=Golovinomyces cichoracearum TaxID=62708 RepID=A0A420HH45_9PEZI|nr:Serine/threonine-protein kinase/endoribonuclease IRE1 [Golovinomyces cichoracearum]
MPPRRPYRNTYSPGNILNFVALIHLLPCLQLCLVDAQQQQHRHREEVLQYIHTATRELNQLDMFQISKTTRNKEAPSSHGPGWKIPIHKSTENDASAIITLAPAESAVAAPSLRLSSSIIAEKSSPQLARSLRDWEVEDFVLLATVDGTLHARDRYTGKEKWHISYEKPMVQINHYPRPSKFGEKYNATIIDDYLWIVEPSRDGTVYIYRPHGPNAGVFNTGLTMKMLVEMTPYGDEDPPVIYTGEKKSNVLKVDANTGKILSWFGSAESLATKETCERGESDFEGTEKCRKRATLILGRTEYTVGIFGRNDGHHIATLKFFEWSPNNYDQDLQYQYSQSASTLDNKYIHSGHNSVIVSLDHAKTIDNDKSGILFEESFQSPVVGVFDVVKPWGTDKKGTSMIILSQPQPPLEDVVEGSIMQSNSIFLNHTQDGSWYAMSAKSYPLVVSGSQAAMYNQKEWPQHTSNWNILNKTQLSEGLLGLHSVENIRATTSSILTIAGSAKMENKDNLLRLKPHSSLPPEYPALYKNFHEISRTAYLSSNNLFQFSYLLIFIFLLFIALHRQLPNISSYPSRNVKRTLVPLIASTNIKTVAEVVFWIKKWARNADIKSQTNTSADVSTKYKILDEVNNQKTTQTLNLPKSDTSKDENCSAGIESPKKKEKKSHRGRRGGVKHKKGAKPNTRPPITLDSESKTSSESNMHDEKVQQTSSQPSDRLETQKITFTPHEIIGSIIRIGSLEVSTDKLIGTGSNGTMVFKGKFDGREVAVKRMLIQFYDIAFQETKLLRESDDHPNVIRYFAQQQAAGFLYIALELCPASLADIVDRPQIHPELAQAGEKDLPYLLYQITNGLRHLHKLRIVHRDLKPQNILVSVDKDKKPRLVVSDFGLCKKLEGEQSSFGATTAHAAGTSGWRAPEILLDDDGNYTQPAVFDASMEHNSSSVFLKSEFTSSRRATRAIDIFSLGLIFFYVLTKGSHPFDCGDRFMREVNIRKGKYDLSPLDILGDHTYEAKDLIGSMLSADSKCRPQAHQVMAHPFFWSAKKKLNFLCDVSDHLEKEKRDPPTAALREFESFSNMICGSDFLKLLGKDFVESMGKQRKYTGTKLLDLLRALRNKKNHYEDMSDKLKKDVGPLPDGYLSFWTRKFPQLLVVCWTIVYDLQWDGLDRFRDYYEVEGV